MRVIFLTFKEITGPPIKLVGFLLYLLCSIIGTGILLVLVVSALVGALPEALKILNLYLDVVVFVFAVNCIRYITKQKQ